jgi:single-strand DNA-binding protein
MAQPLTIWGYLSRDAETSTTRGGDQVTRWNIPVRQGFGESERTNWYRVNIWGKRAEYAARSRKGDFAVVIGELTIGEYEGKPQYELRAYDFQAVRPAPKDGQREPDGSRGAPLDTAKQHFPDADLADEIPFLTMNSPF